MFLRKTKERAPAPITMSGVRMGERLLQIGIDDPAIAGAIAAKVGLSGSAAVAVADEMAAEKARRAAARAGALVDVSVTPLQTLPFGDEGFDVVVVHGMRVLIASDRSVRAVALRECHRVLRSGGRIITIETGARSGMVGVLAAVMRQTEKTPTDSPAGETVSALKEAGFRPVRVVGELEGYTFTEGLKPALR